MAENLHPLLSDTPCPRCIRAYLKGRIRKRAIQRLPEGVRAPRDNNGHKQCWDCQAADTLSRLGAGDPDRHSRVAVGNDRCEQYLLPGAPIGLAYNGILKKNGPDDWENQQEWMSQSAHIVFEIGLRHTPCLHDDEATCRRDIAEELEDMGLATISCVKDGVYTVNRTDKARELVMTPEEYEVNQEELKEQLAYLEALEEYTGLEWEVSPGSYITEQALGRLAYRLSIGTTHGMDSCSVVLYATRDAFIGGGDSCKVDSKNGVPFSKAVDFAMSMFLKELEKAQTDVAYVGGATEKAAYADETLTFADFTGTKT